MLNIKARKRARLHAIQALYQKAIAQTTDSELKTQYFTDNVDRYKVDWDFFKCLIDGVTRFKNEISEYIVSNATKDISMINAVDLAIAKLGIYELIDCLESPHQLIIKEYVEQTFSMGSNKGYMFINALLEKIASEVR